MNEKKPLIVTGKMFKMERFSFIRETLQSATSS